MYLHNCFLVHVVLFIYYLSLIAAITLLCQTSSGNPLVLNVGCSAVGPFPIVSSVCDFDSGSRTESCSFGKFFCPCYFVVPLGQEKYANIVESDYTMRIVI